jgi:hypothetical protein
MCTTKRAYDSRGAASFFATTDGLRAYECPHCGCWHLTSKNVGQREDG